MARWNFLVPLGALDVVTPGTTVLLSANCGPLAGALQGTDYTQPALPGQTLRQLILCATGNDAVLLPRGSTLSGNPENVIAYLPKGIPVTIPNGAFFDGGVLPENLCVDCAAASTVYGCGVV